MCYESLSVSIQSKMKTKIILSHYILNLTFNSNFSNFDEDLAYSNLLHFYLSISDFTS